LSPRMLIIDVPQAKHLHHGEHRVHIVRAASTIVRDGRDFKRVFPVFSVQSVVKLRRASR
jgi:hypothetical protein